MEKLTIDFETRSAAPLKKCGAAAYAQDGTTDVICLALKRHGEEPVVWFSPDFRFPTIRLPVVSDETVLKMIGSAEVIEAHNAQFEYFIWKYVMPRYGFPMFDASKLRCSAAKAAMYGLPRDLAGACAAAGVPQQKDMEGSRLMMSLCKPRKALKAEMLRDPDWETRLYWRGTPEEFERLALYCMQDVRAEEALSDALPDLPEREQKLWRLDLAINQRGIRVDVPAVKAILNCIDRHSGSLKAEFRRMTGLESPTQRDATLRHLLALGVEMDGLTSKEVEETLSTTGNETAKRILQIRQSLSKSSTAKYNAFLEAKGPDDRIRGCFLYHGAGTGRWSGRLIQPQNFPRGAFPDVEPCIELFEKGDLDGVRLFYDDPMAAASTCLRSMIVPEPGKEFICADYSSIEGRVLAWLAGEESALAVYREGRDPYRVAASAIYHVPVDSIDKSQRQVGKVAELACIAEGSLVLTDSGLVPIERVTTGHRLWDGVEWVSHGGVVCRGEKEVLVYEGLCATGDHAVWVEGKQGPVSLGVAAARGAHLLQTGDGRNPLRLGSDYLARKKMESGKNAGGDYRGCTDRCPGETQKLEGNRRSARVYDILNAGPRHRFTVSNVLVHNCGYQGGVGAFNMMALAYGVSLPEHEVRDIVEKWRDSRPLTVRLWRDLERAAKAAINHPGYVYAYRGIKFTIRGKMLAMKLPSGRCLWYANPRIERKEMSWGEQKDVIAFDGVNSTTRKWGRQYLYGGLLAENVTQATARDILVNGMFAAEEASYPIVMHVHDELIAEVPEGFGSVEEFESLMCRSPEWAAGLPLKAEGWRGKRYKK